jgi:hypothetical protein
MLDNIFETKVKGSRTIFLDVPSKDYFSSYDSVDKSTAQEMVNTYFQINEKDGVPHVDEAEEDNAFNIVKIKINVQHGIQNNIEPYTTENFFGISDAK